MVSASIPLSIEYFLSRFIFTFDTLSWSIYLSTASPFYAFFILYSPFANISSDITFTMLISAANLTLFYSSISSLSSSMSISISISSKSPSKPLLAGAVYFFYSICCCFMAFFSANSASVSSLFLLSATTFLRYSGSAEGLNARAFDTVFELAPWATLRML